MSDVTGQAGMPMSTTFELPGMRVRDNLGVCYGLVVRSMGVVGVRFDSSEIGQQLTEIVAYGTAVTIDRAG